jgi:citrate lyase beta subunit
MEPLPHTLLEITPPPTGRGALVYVGDSGIERRFVVVELDVSLETLRQAIAGGATGIALTGCRAGADIQRLAVLLSVAEAEENLAESSTPILAITDGILPAPVSPQGFSGKTTRLAGLVWDQSGLVKTLGVEPTPTESGEWPPAFAAARATVLLTAAAAGIPAYDSASELTAELFLADCERSHDEGFFGRLASDPAQMAIIQTVYAGGRGSSGQARG